MLSAPTHRLRRSVGWMASGPVAEVHPRTERAGGARAEALSYSLDPLSYSAAGSLPRPDLHRQAQRLIWTHRERVTPSSFRS